MNAYKYDPLPRSPSTIRLLSLEPCQSRDGPLRATLFPVALDCPPRYMALSYRWGDPGDNQPISIRPHISSLPFANDAVLQIWPNLASALRHARLASEPVVMWTDAICINQEDETEKAAQLPLMTHIYRKASTVLSWLGEPGPRDADALRNIPELASRWEDWEQQALGSESSGVFSHFPPRPEQRPLAKIGTQELANPVMRLLRRDYFNRIWIVQEVGMGGRRVIIRLGDNEISWDQLVKAVAFIVADGKGIYDPDIFENLFMLDSARGADAVDVYEKRPQGQQVPLVKVLWRYRKFDAKENRDKVYAILGLALDDKVKRVVEAGISYKVEEKSDQAVFQEVAHAVIASGDLSILSVPRGGKESPSWVPDWTVRDPCMSLPLTSLTSAPDFHPTSASYRGPYATTSSNGMELKLNAVLLPQQIKEIGPELSRPPPPDSDSQEQTYLLDRRRGEVNTILEWERMARAGLLTRDEPYPGSTEPLAGVVERRGQAFGKTLLAGRQYTHSDGNFTSGDAFEIWNRNGLGQMRLLRKFNLTKSVLAFGIGSFASAVVSAIGGTMGICHQQTADEAYIAKQFSNEVAAAASGKRFFVTKDGLFGLGPRDLKESDSIVLVLGANMPLVVRRALVPNGIPGRERWELVGDVYLHSDEIMKGEAWEQGDKFELVLV